MSKYGSPSAVALMDGYNILGAKLKGLNLKIEAIQDDDSGLGDPNESNRPVGKQRGTLTQTGGFYDTTVNGLHQAMANGLPTSPQASVRIFCFGCQGQLSGGVYYGLQGEFTVGYELVLSDGKLTRANVVHAVAGLVERGYIVQPLATKTANWDTKALSTEVDYTADPSQIAIPITSNTQANPTVVTTPNPHGLTTNDIILISGNVTSSPSINGSQQVTVLSPTTFSVPVNTSAGSGGTGGQFVRANSSNGAAGYLHVTAFSGFTGFVGKLRSSPDDVTYADLIVFSNVTSAPAAQRVTSAGTVDRFTCFTGTVTGAGSITVFAGINRL